MAEPAHEPVADPSSTSSARRRTPFGLAITVAGRYRRGACIAKGGSSTVHRATDGTTGAEVALKSFHVHRAFDPTLLPALEAARQTAARVGPDVMVPIVDLGADDDGTPFVVMPLVRGETLGARLERGPLGDHEAGELASRLLTSLDALHAGGVTHGDLSPDNVFLREDGRALLLDHEGLGALGSPRPTRATEGFGQNGGLREARDDHRALVALARALTGRAQAPIEAGEVDRFVSALRHGPDGAMAMLGDGGAPRPPRGHVPRWVWYAVPALVALALVVLVASLAR